LVGSRHHPAPQRFFKKGLKMSPAYLKPRGDIFILGTRFMEECFEFHFSKTQDMIYISHLDLMRLFARAARRADLPVALTRGFSPRFQIRVKKALKLGVASDHEEGEIVLTLPLEPAQIKQRWQEQLPQGIVIKEIKPSGPAR
jgi:hypothetical protein